MNSFKVKFNTNPAFKVKFEPIGYDVVPDPYIGEYDVIPKFETQTLSTKNKNMVADVTVEEIPVEKVGNPSGGYTVTIGG